VAGECRFDTSRLILERQFLLAGKRTAVRRKRRTWLIIASVDMFSDLCQRIPSFPRLVLGLRPCPPRKGQRTLGGIRGAGALGSALTACGIAAGYSWSRDVESASSIA
jgi:hypothetical protein